jgi:hypothetical protein
VKTFGRFSFMSSPEAAKEYFRRACDFPLAGCVRPRQHVKDLARAPNLMRETRQI